MHKSRGGGGEKTEETYPDLGDPEDIGDENTDLVTDAPQEGGRRRRRSMHKSRKSKRRSRRQTAGRRKRKSKHSRRVKRTTGG